MTTKSLRRRQDRTLFMLLQMSGDVHPNPGPATKYPCPVCARNVTSRGVSYQCNRCSGWVHAKCSGLLNAAQYRKVVIGMHPLFDTNTVEAALSKCSLPTDCQRDEKIFRTILLRAASHHIPTGRHRLHEEPVPAEILDVMTRRDDLRKRDCTSLELPRLNKDIQKRFCEHKQQKWILLRIWTIRQILPSCGELSKELTAEQNAR